MLWLQSCIIVILIKAAISFTSFCSEYDGASCKTPQHLMYVSEWQRVRNIKHLMNKNPEWCCCWKHLSYFVSSVCFFLFLFVSSLALAICVHHFEIYFAFVTFFFTVLFSLSVLWGRRIYYFPFLNSFAGSIFSPLSNLFSDFSCLFFILLCSEAISRF